MSLSKACNKLPNNESNERTLLTIEIEISKN